MEHATSRFRPWVRKNDELDMRLRRDLRGRSMKRFIEGADRGQSTLFPECLEDWIDEDNPVRAVDAFVDRLDLLGPGVRWGRSRGDRAAFLPSLWRC